MTRRSPHTISYRDLVALSEKVKAFYQSRHDGAKDRGTTNLDALTHDLETAKALHRLLKLAEPGRQTNMHELFNQIQHGNSNC